MKIVAIVVASLFLILVPKTESQLFRPANPLPLCASQFALANYACSRLPFSPPAPIPSPPSPPPPDDDDDSDGENSHHHSHGHGRHHRRHRHRQGNHIHEPTPAEEDCCHWAKDVDDECVCDILARLPDFLSRAVHQYIVSVGDSCQITYSCRGRIKI